MNDGIPAHEAKAPFDPQPADLGGCGKPAVIGCLALLVILAIGFVIFLAKARGMLEWALSRYQDVVVANLSEEVTEQERLRLVTAFDNAREAIREDRMEPSALQRLQRFMSSPPRSGESIGPDTVRELSEVLESIAKSPVELPEVKPTAPPLVGTTAAIHHARI